MTRARRRITRKDVQKSPSRSQSPSTVDAEPGDGGEEESCPACKAGAADVVQVIKESWIECDVCKTWFHWRCAGNGENMELINRWYVAPFSNTDNSPLNKSQVLPLMLRRGFNACYQSKDSCGCFIIDTSWS
jgi:hypothetical protein